MASAVVLAKFLLNVWNRGTNPTGIPDLEQNAMVCYPSVYRIELVLAFLLVTLAICFFLYYQLKGRIYNVGTVVRPSPLVRT